MNEEIENAFNQWLDNPNVLSPATPYLAKKQAFFAGYKSRHEELEAKLQVVVEALEGHCQCECYADYLGMRCGACNTLEKIKAK